MRRNLLLSLTIATVFASLSPPTYAYLDPGTGSIILQGVIAAIATVGFTAKIYWQRIKAFFQGESGQEKKEEREEQAEHPPRE